METCTVRGKKVRFYGTQIVPQIDCHLLVDGALLLPVASTNYIFFIKVLLVHTDSWAVILSRLILLL